MIRTLSASHIFSCHFIDMIIKMQVKVPCTSIYMHRVIENVISIYSSVISIASEISILRSTSRDLEQYQNCRYTCYPLSRRRHQIRLTQAQVSPPSARGLRGRRDRAGENSRPRAGCSSRRMIRRGFLLGRQ